ncbi:hypothetical protein ACCC92_27855, partial [Mucilaginibacter sp. Mucisp84]
PWAMLLHSGHADHPHNRFDILVADPLTTLTTQGDITYQAGRASQGDPLELLQQALDTCGLHAEPTNDLPFQGGALGLFGYDLG